VKIVCNKSPILFGVDSSNRIAPLLPAYLSKTESTSDIVLGFVSKNAASEQ
jgi:hypothetical protein